MAPLHDVIAQISDLQDACRALSFFFFFLRMSQLDRNVHDGIN